MKGPIHGVGSLQPHLCGGRELPNDDFQTAWGICKCTHLPVGAGGEHRWAEVRRGVRGHPGSGRAQCVPERGD